MKRTALWAGYVVYLVVLAYLVWNPEPTVPSSAVWHVSHFLNQAGIPVSPSTAEFGLNVLLFVPMSLLGSVLIPRLSVAEWVTVGFVASFAVELVQNFLLSSRSADAKDIVSNTLGALIGAVLARLLVAAARAQAARAATRVGESPGEAPA